MTSDKDFKRLVRGRMLKTGESYTAARSHLVTQRQARGKVAEASTPPPDYAKLAGRSDALVEARTGRDWRRWVEALDAAGASQWRHPEIARYLQGQLGLPGWWAQTVTVGYERIKGLRAIGQRRDGGFEVNKSRTYPVPLARLYRGFSDKRTRARWLPGVDLTIRTAARQKHMRVTWPDGTLVVFGFVSKGREKSAAHVQHGPLPDRAAADRVKAFWTERLGVLAEVLA